MPTGSNTIVDAKIKQEIQRSKELFASSIKQFHNFEKTSDAIKAAKDKFEKHQSHINASSDTLLEGLSHLNDHLDARQAKFLLIADDATLEKAWQETRDMLELLLQ